MIGKMDKKKFPHIGACVPGSRIIFRDRSLKKNEKSHYVCNKCGIELHPDFAYKHDCKGRQIKWKENFLE